MKTCSKCGQIKALEEFHYRQAQCKPCRKVVRAASYPAHREEIAASNRAWYLANREEKAAYARAWYLATREEIAAYRLAHHEERAAYSRAWQRANPDKCRDKKVRRRAHKMAVYVEPVSRTVVFQSDGGRCHVCHKKVDPKTWHLDHLIPLSLGGEHSYRNVAVACPKCNLRRGNTGPAQLRLIG